MDFIAIFVCILIGVWLLKRQIHAHPVVFYSLSALMVVAMFAALAGLLPRSAISLLNPLMLKGGLGVGFFLLVMWIGVFPRSGALSKGLRPIRAELSIMACILVAGHALAFAGSYGMKIASDAQLQPAVFAAIAIAAVLLILGIVLGATSLRVVKRRMKAVTWKKIQRWAYLFYGLVFVHLLLMLGPSALGGGFRSIVMICIYALLFGGYLAARIFRFVRDRQENVDLAETVKDQGFAQ